METSLLDRTVATVKILLDIAAGHYPASGIGRYTKELATRLPGLNGVDEVRYVNRQRISERAHFGDGKSPAPYNKARHRIMRKMPERLRRSALSMRAKRLRKALARYSDYVYLSPNFLLPPFDGRTAVTIHDLSVFTYPETHPIERVKLLQADILASCARADHIIADTWAIKREIATFGNVPPEKITVVPLGVDALFQPRSQQDSRDLLESLGIEWQKFFLTVGVIEPRKDLETLLMAYGKLPPNVRKQVPLVVVGNYGWLSEQTMAKINHLQELGTVRHLTNITDDALAMLYSGCTAFVMPSLYEGFGLPLAEAMCCGALAIASDDPALVEVAAGGAWHFKRRDHSVLAEQLEKVLAEPENAAMTQKTALERGRSFTWDATARATVALLQSEPWPVEH